MPMMVTPPDMLLITVPEVVGMASLSGVVVIGSIALVYRVMQDAREERMEHRQERREERRVREIEAEADAASKQALYEAMNALKER